MEIWFIVFIVLHRVGFAYPVKISVFSSLSLEVEGSWYDRNHLLNGVFLYLLHYPYVKLALDSIFIFSVALYTHILLTHFVKT